MIYLLFLLAIPLLPTFILSLLAFIIPQKRLGLYAIVVTLFSILFYIWIAQIAKEDNYMIILYGFLIGILIVYSFILVNMTLKK